MNKGNPTGYTAVPQTAYPPTANTEGYQPAAPSYPPQPLPAYYDDPARAAAQQQLQQTNTMVVNAAQPATTIVHAAVRPPNYLALSILNLLCCCFPLGIVGLLYSLRVDSEFAAGHYEEARRASESTKNINYVGIGLGICLFIIGVIIILIIILVAVAQNNN